MLNVDPASTAPMPSQTSPYRRRPSDPFRDNPNNERFTPTPPPKDDMLSAVRESVTVKSSDPRSKVGRSHTSNLVTGTTTPPRSRRSASTDSVPSPVDKPSKSRGKASKKASMHADIIDRLDFSGVGAAMLHHDGPFDACAPSRNKHKHKAPMMAWGTENEDPSLDPLTDRRLSPLAQSTLAAMSSYDSPYPASNVYPASPTSPDSMPKKRVDALAEAWGIAEPEPFEEFHAGGGERSAASSIKNGKDGHTSSRRAKDARDTYRDYLDDGRHPRRPRSTLPPPQPISLPGSRPHGTLSSSLETPSADEVDSLSTPNLAPPEGSPRRSRSLMSRIRKMRDAPNVPVAHDEDTEPSDSPDSIDGGTAPLPSSRPSHKHQNSFLGRFGRNPNVVQNNISPTSDFSNDFVYVEDGASTREKNLPSPPSDKERDYFGDSTTSQGRGLSRKTSLMRKVVKGVRGRGTKQ